MQVGSDRRGRDRRSRRLQLSALFRGRWGGGRADGSSGGQTPADDLGKVGAAEAGGQHRAGGGDILAIHPLGHPRKHRRGALDGQCVQLLASGGQPQCHPPSVIGGLLARDPAGLHQPVDKAAGMAALGDQQLAQRAK
jgi:hypothetical protein